MKQKLTFLNEDDAGFVIDITPIPEDEAGPDKPAFKVKINMQNADKLPQQAEDPRDTLFMEIATDTLNKLMTAPDIFDVTTEGFEVHVMGPDTSEDIKGMPGFMMGTGGDA